MWFPELLLSFAACQDLIHLFQEQLRKVVRDSFQCFICPNYLFLPFRVNETSWHCLSQALCSLITLLFTWNSNVPSQCRFLPANPHKLSDPFLISSTTELNKSESMWLSTTVFHLKLAHYNMDECFWPYFRAVLIYKPGK